MNTCYNPFSLAGKKILVTGASSGIGKATAIACAGLGATLIITGRNADRLQETMDMLAGENHSMIVADIAVKEQLETLVDSIDSIDGLANCAGIGNSTLSVFATKKKIDAVYDTNLFAPIELMRLLFKKKKIANGASLVSVASIGGIMRCTNGNIIYGSAKAALNSWMKFLAKEYGAKGIRANSVCPGMIETPLIQNSAFNDEQLDADRQKYALKRYGRPEEVAYAIAFLLSDASSFITGISLPIEGGVTI